MAAILESKRDDAQSLRNKLEPVASGLSKQSSPRAPKAPDDFSRLVTGFIIGVVLSFGLMIADFVVFDFVDRRFLGGAEPPGLWRLVFTLSLTLMFGALPVMCAAMLARGDRVLAARQTLSYCYCFLVGYALILLHPLPVGPALWLIVLGSGGLAGVCVIAVLETYRARWRLGRKG